MHGAVDSRVFRQEITQAGYEEKGAVPTLVASSEMLSKIGLGLTIRWFRGYPPMDQLGIDCMTHTRSHFGQALKNPT